MSTEKSATKSQKALEKFEASQTPKDSKAPVRFYITDGDGRFELHRQLELIGTKLLNFPYFRIKGNLEGLAGNDSEHIQITGIAAQYPLTGHEWVISGVYPRESPFGGLLWRIPGTFTGSYNTRTRKGHIDVTFDEKMFKD